MSNQHQGVLLKLVQLGLDVNATDDKGCTLLHVAIERGNSSVIRILVDSGACIEAICDEGETVLYKAVLTRFLRREDLEYVFNVCTTKLNGHNNKPVHRFVNQKNKDGYTALHNAIQANNQDAVKCLLNHKADSAMKLLKFNHAKSWRITSALSPLQLACVFGNYEALEALQPLNCDEWADTKEGRLGIIALTWINLIDAYKAEKRSPISLGWYQYKEEKKFIKIATLLAPNATDINKYLPGLRAKRTLLHFSVFKKSKLLLTSICENPDVNLEIPDGYEKTALQAGLAKKNVDILDYQILVQNGANIHAPIITDNISRTVLMKSIELGSISLVRQVLLAGTHNDEQMLCSESKKSLFQDKINFKCSIVQLLLLADYRLSSLYSAYSKQPMLKSTGSIFKMIEARQSIVFFLKQQTRKVIRQHLFHSKHIESLPLPRLLKSYLYIPELQEFHC